MCVYIVYVSYMWFHQKFGKCVYLALLIFISLLFYKFKQFFVVFFCYFKIHAYNYTSIRPTNVPEVNIKVHSEYDSCEESRIKRPATDFSEVVFMETFLALLSVT